MDGIINIYKEKGYTSHDVVAKLRGILKQKKIGHTGTLDPDAAGVLPVCLGKATKLFELLIEKEKSYHVMCRLGLVTDTQDMTGKIVQEKNVTCTEEEILLIVDSFLGEQNQIPPMYSAVKVHGKRLYELAREGKEIERKKRSVYFHQIIVVNVDIGQKKIEMNVSCSKGTYIRTLCHDIGERLGCGACMESLIRTKAGHFCIEQSITLDQVKKLYEEGQIENVITHIDSMFQNLLAVTVLEEHQKRIYNGNSFLMEHIYITEPEDRVLYHDRENYRVYDSGNQFIGLYEYRKEKEQFHVVKMFI